MSAYTRTDLTFVCKRCDVDLVITLRTQSTDVTVAFLMRVLHCPGCGRKMHKNGQSRRDPFQGPNPRRRPPRLPKELEG